jgi:hypothetical protein
MPARGRAMAIARTLLREQSPRLAELALEFGQHSHDPVLVRCADRGQPEER